MQDLVTKSGDGLPYRPGQEEIDASKAPLMDHLVELRQRLIYSLIGRIPVRGELIRHPSGIEFEVLDADARRLKRLKIHVRKAA